MLAPWKKSYDKPRQCIKKQKHHLLTKVKAMVLPVFMYGCESWTIKKVECQNIAAFKSWCWRRLSRVHWTTRRSNQSILKEINPEHSLEGLLLNLCLVAQLCPTLCDLMDCSLPGPSVHWDSPGKNTGVGCHALLQGIFPTQGSNPGLPHCRWILYHLSHRGSWSWSSSNTLATWCEELTHWKRPWCWERLKAKREGGGRGWDG